MYCANIYCIYWEKNCCTFEEVSMDRHGMCLEQYHVDISSEMLAQERRRTRRMLDEQVDIEIEF